MHLTRMHVLSKASRFTRFPQWPYGSHLSRKFLPAQLSAIELHSSSRTLNAHGRKGGERSARGFSKGVEGRTGLEGFSRWEKSGENFPDWIEKWNPVVFRKTGYGLAVMAVTAGMLGGPWVGLGVAVPVCGYWWLGLKDLAQERHSIRRNFPVLGNMRYLLESIRPEIRQYFIEADNESVPFTRLQRIMVYQRAKGMPDTLPFGTRRDIYSDGYEWINHSISPSDVGKVERKVLVGGGLVTQPYEASILNISGMSYGALSDNAILALNGAAKQGGFYHNTGEGGISQLHLERGGPLVWNVGTGYFGCRDERGAFCADNFSTNSRRPEVKMIEVKLSQGAKPAHGGILPASKVTPLIAEARGVKMGVDCVSPPNHSAFQGPRGVVDFVDLLRELSGGKPVGVKLCVGRAEEVAAVILASMEKGEGHGPDFYTVDGSEGGTGAAPPEFSNSVGTPLVEGVVLVDDLLTGAGMRDRVKIICSGKVLSGFSIVRNVALGADICNSARAMMFALGCVQALKCSTNHCPTGVATQDKELMKGLVVSDKTERVYRYHKKTVHTALEIAGAAGVDSTSALSRHMIMRRVGGVGRSYADLFPPVTPGSLLGGTAPPSLLSTWTKAEAMLAGGGGGGLCLT
ncbi:unnamed protein product [Discosporangium mesarthrocarpum]